MYDYDIALSFAGEDRNYVEKTADHLVKMGFKVFYDKYEKASLWGKDLYTHLQEVYFKKAKYTVIFVSKHYKDKLWTNHERKSAQARALKEKGEYILPAKFDDTELPGLLLTTGYINLREYSPEQFADIIKQKVGVIRRSEFFPKNSLDRLYEFIGEEDEEIQKIIYWLTFEIFETLKLINESDRYVLSIAALKCENSYLPDYIRINLDYLSRLTFVKKTELIKIFDKLNDLDIFSTIKKVERQGKVSEYIEIIWEYSSLESDQNITYLFVSIIRCLYSFQCPNCAEKSLDRLDFSELSNLTGFEHEH